MYNFRTKLMEKWLFWIARHLLPVNVTADAKDGGRPQHGRGQSRISSRSRPGSPTREE